MDGHDAERDEVGGVTGWARAVRREADRDDAFWTRQRAGIRERNRSHRVRSVAWMAALGASAAVAAALAVFLVRGPAPAPTGPVRSAVATADDQLLMDVENAVMREVPLAFEPVDFLLPEARDSDRD